MQNEDTSIKPNKRLVVFMDGTWNDPKDRTNVWRLKTLVREKDNQDTPQLIYYGTGVGTMWNTRLRGGIAGYGLSKNIIDTYRWLVDDYDDKAHIFVFGFSRGAFSARSLIGLIAKCGLLRPDAAMSTEEIYERYRNYRDMTSIHELKYKLDRTNEDEWLLLNSRRVPIEFTGIWDTVGALGIPFGNIPMISRKSFYFHNTRLSTIFKHGAHALALDEHRKAYDATLWTNFIPVKSGTNEIVTDRLAKNYYPNFEQRWFVGAHSNVGGGYSRDLLAQTPLRWIQKRADKAGLKFRSQVTLLGREHVKGEVVDSYKEFMKGAYRAIKFGRRHFRAIGREPWKVKGGFVESVNETIDATVLERWQQVSDYRNRSLNLDVWADRAKYDLHSPINGSSVPAWPTSDSVRMPWDRL